MPNSPDPREELDLELPDLDGEDLAETEVEPAVDDDLDLRHPRDDGENPFDDANAEEAAPVEVAAFGPERGWLEGAEDAANLDVGPLDVVLQPEGKILEDDEADGRGHADDVPWIEDEAFVVDAGEEGPLAEDEELREEDLPALDADEDGEVADEELYERAALAVDDELRWDDRAWARVGDATVSNDDHDDSERLPAPSEGPSHRTRDATWKALDDGGRVMAAGFVPGESVVLALATPDRARALLVRIQPDGEARIIAEVDPHLGADPADDDGTPCIVTFVRWDGARGCLFVGGNFGVEAYRPA